MLCCPAEHFSQRKIYPHRDKTDTANASVTADIISNVVRKNPAEGKEYIIVSGERRFSAVRMLRDRYEKSGDETKSRLFSKVTNST